MEHRLHLVWTNEQIRSWQKQVEDALTPEGIAQWLSSLGENVCGLAFNVSRCPVRNYLNEKLPHLDCEVGINQIKTTIPWTFARGQYKGLTIEDIFYIGQPMGARPMPAWAKEFIDELDTRFCRQTAMGAKIRSGELPGIYQEYEFPIKASLALELLHEICQGDESKVA